MLPVFFLLGCAVASHAQPAGTSPAPALAAGQAEAVFAGGCFWCVEAAFEEVQGVLDAVSGYTGGDTQAPTYQQVSAHATTHIESVRVVYDPAVVSYSQLLDVFWHNIDPTQGDGQFCDKGHQYTSAIFTNDPSEQAEARASLDKVSEQLGAAVKTVILPASTFWVAEDYHQDFHRKNPTRYLSYRKGCGRDARLEQIWGSSKLSLQTGT